VTAAGFAQGRRKSRRRECGVQGFEPAVGNHRPFLATTSGRDDKSRGLERERKGHAHREAAKSTTK
jgi:hypothetical protein